MEVKVLNYKGGNDKMEYLVLNSYLEFKNKKKKRVYDIIKEMSKVHRMAFSFLIVFGVMAIMGVICSEYVVVYIGVAVEMVCNIILLKEQKKVDIKNSRINIREKDNEYSQFLGWLKSIKYGEKEQIKQLCYRCENIIEKEKMEREKNVKELEIIFTIFVAPLLIAIVNWSLGLQGKADEHIILAVMVAMFAVALYLMIKGIFKALQEKIYRTEQDMKYMVNDLHGVLDRCFKIKENDFAK